MKKAFLVILSIIALAQSAFAASFEEDRHVQDLIVRISQETLNSEYDKAITRTCEPIASDPNCAHRSDRLASPLRQAPNGPFPVKAAWTKQKRENTLPAVDPSRRVFHFRMSQVLGDNVTAFSEAVFSFS